MKELFYSIKHRFLSRKFNLGVLSVVVLTSVAVLLPPGMDTPEPVAPFLKGTFPNKLTTTIELSQPFNQSSFSAILVITAEPASTRFHMAERSGRFYWMDKNGNGSDKTLFMDISSRVWTGQDSGVLGMAFHPEYNQVGSSNRNYLYVYYVTAYSGNQYIRLSRFTRMEANQTADPNSEVILFDQVLGPTLHRGGGLVFGNDGFLYLAIGDLGWKEQSQNITDRLSGGVLRIDVDKKGGNISHPVRRTLQSVGRGTTGDYYIPSDNPFLDSNGSVFEEYYTLGCRNPHRMTIDRTTGDLYIGNVGSNNGDKREEVNRVIKGANFGWPYREGYNDRPDLMARPSTILGIETDPIHEYGHLNGNSWVCGGYVYRGTALPQYYGHYIFADGGSRKIWALNLSGNPPYDKEEIATSSSTFYTFGEDQDGEIYLGSNNLQKITSGAQYGDGIIPDGTYFIRVRHSQQFLDVNGGGDNNGASIIQATFDGSARQQWVVENLGNNQYRIARSDNGKVIDVAAFRTDDGANVHQWTYNNTSNQKWLLEPEENTYFRIKGLQSNLDLEVADNNQTSGANVQIGNRETNNHFNQLWEFIPAAGGNPIPPNAVLPARLSQTNAFKNLNTLEPQDGVLPYDVISELWSDGAAKYRWVVVPNDGTHDTAAEDITWSEEGEWAFPVGTVFIKHFEIQTDAADPNSIRKVETRFLVRGETGYYAITYRWLPDGSDAVLLETSFEDQITMTDSNGQTRQQRWYYPSRSECFVCHTEASGQVLGVKTRHLNRSIVYPVTNINANQIETYNHLGMFDQDIDVAAIANFLSAKAIDDQTESVEDRARSYLDINCSSCHRPNGGTRATWNALLSEDLATAGIINGAVVDDLGIEGARVIVPGDTAKSILYQRIREVNTTIAMPPLAKNVAHQEGVDLIAEWILGMPLEGQGLTATYFDNIDFTNPVMQRTDATVDFDWFRSAPVPQMEVNTFTIRWEGYVELPQDGEYTFTTNADDGVRLWINHDLLFEDWTTHPPVENSGSQWLPGGVKIPIKLEYFEGGGEAVIQLLWSGPGISKQIIPAKHLFPYEANGLTATYFDNIDFTIPKLNRQDPEINFNWGGGSPDPTIAVNTFTVRWEGFVMAPTAGTYQFFSNTDDGVRLWVDNQLLFEDWTDHSATENSGQVSLPALVKVPIKMEYYENGGGAVAQLRWSGPGVSKAIIPANALFPIQNGDLCAYPTSGNAPLVVLFDGNTHTSLTGNNLTYSWDFGDGVTRSGSQATTTHTYNYPGTYQAQLSVTDGNATYQTNTTITVNPGTIDLGSPPNSTEATLVKARIQLQGPWANQAMNTVLFQQNLLPFLQPYMDPQWDFSGHPTLRSFPMRLNNEIVDWVLIKIHDPNDRNMIHYQRVGLVQKDGWIVDLEGSEYVDFGVLNINSGHISIHHRNHLGIISEEAVGLD